MPPAAIAGVIRNGLVDPAEVVEHCYSATWYAWFASFFENPLVSRVRRRLPIRMFRFWRSTYDVLSCFGSGRPVIVDLLRRVGRRFEPIGECCGSDQRDGFLAALVDQNRFVTAVEHLVHEHVEALACFTDGSRSSFWRRSCRSCFGIQPCKS